MLWKLFSSEKKLNEALERSSASHDLSVGVLSLASNDDLAAPEVVTNQTRLYLDNSENQGPHFRRTPQVNAPAAEKRAKSRLYLEGWSEKDEQRLRAIEEEENCWSGYLASSN
jgi:hypothetical protein